MEGGSIPEAYPCCAISEGLSECFGKGSKDLKPNPVDYTGVLVQNFEGLLDVDYWIGLWILDYQLKTEVYVSTW